MGSAQPFVGWVGPRALLRLGRDCPEPLSSPPTLTPSSFWAQSTGGGDAPSLCPPWKQLHRKPEPQQVQRDKDRATAPPTGPVPGEGTGRGSLGVSGCSQPSLPLPHPMGPWGISRHLLPHGAGVGAYPAHCRGGIHSRAEAWTSVPPPVPCSGHSSHMHSTHTHVHTCAHSHPTVLLTCSVLGSASSPLLLLLSISSQRTSRAPDPGLPGTPGRGREPQE